MLTKQLYTNNIIKTPIWLPNNVLYETIMGSQAYGVNTQSSDTDVYGFCMPPLEMIFPHLSGEIEGFGQQKQKFQQFQAHHINYNNTEYDITIYSIVKYFQLCMQCNPNMIDSLFTPIECVIYQDNIAKMVRKNRTLFLHKGAYFKFMGYAHSQLSKLNNKKLEGKRKQTVEKYGYDAKYLYHLVRLVKEVEQILIDSDIDLKANINLLTYIRQGKWNIKDASLWFKYKEQELKLLYEKSSLPHKPNEQKIKQLLIDCIEEYYGKLSFL